MGMTIAYLTRSYRVNRVESPAGTCLINGSIVWTSLRHETNYTWPIGDNSGSGLSWVVRSGWNFHLQSHSFLFFVCGGNHSMQYLTLNYLCLLLYLNPFFWGNLEPGSLIAWQKKFCVLLVLTLVRVLWLRISTNSQRTWRQVGWQMVMN